MQTLQELIRQLPPHLQEEVKEFAEFLLERRAKKFGRKLRQDWAGALREYRDQYTSLELQKKPWNGGGIENAPGGHQRFPRRSDFEARERRTGFERPF